MISVVLPGIPADNPDTTTFPLLSVIWAVVIDPVPAAAGSIKVPLNVNTPPFTVPLGFARAIVEITVEFAKHGRELISTFRSIPAKRVLRWPLHLKRNLL